MNLADAGVVVVLTSLIFVGLRRGLIGQCLLLAATLVSLLVAAVVAYLVATQADAGPGLARLAAPIAFFIALALSSWILKLLARGITRIVHKLPFATVDRLLGALVSIAVGVIIMSLLFLGLISIQRDNPVSREVRAAQSTPFLLEAGRWTATAGGRYSKFLQPLGSRFEAAVERLGGLDDIL